MTIIEALRKADEEGRVFVSLNDDAFFLAGSGYFGLTREELLSEEWKPAGPRQNGNRVLDFKLPQEKP